MNEFELNSCISFFMNIHNNRLVVIQKVFISEGLGVNKNDTLEKEMKINLTHLSWSKNIPNKL